MQETLFDFNDVSPHDNFVRVLQAKCDDIVADMKFPKHFLVVNKNVGKTVTSFSVATNEPTSPFGDVDVSKAESAAGFIYMKEPTKKADSGKIQIHVPLRMTEAVRSPMSAETKMREPKGADAYCEVKFRLDDSGLIPYLENLIRLSLRSYISSQPTFACCHLYKECSAVGHCVHNNPLFFSACSYRGNLLKGKVFLGEMQNV